jgi:hypothetical protein
MTASAALDRFISGIAIRPSARHFLPFGSLCRAGRRSPADGVFEGQGPLRVESRSQGRHGSPYERMPQGNGPIPVKPSEAGMSVAAARKLSVRPDGADGTFGDPLPMSYAYVPRATFRIVQPRRLRYERQHPIAKSAAVRHASAGTRGHDRRLCPTFGRFTLPSLPGACYGALGPFSEPRGQCAGQGQGCQRRGSVRQRP